jgi:acetyl-CoA C-acetyltransferase
MLTATLQGLVDRFNLHGERLGDVVGGAVMKHARDFNLVRECVLSTTLSRDTPAFDIQQACGTGLEAAMVVANKIALGHIECGIAGGVDTTSDAPIALNEKLRKVLLDLSRAKTPAQRLAVATRLRPSMLASLLCHAMASHARACPWASTPKQMAKEWDIAREAQDELAFNSHKNLAKAYESGFFNDLMTPFKGVTKDNNLRADLTIEKLRTLKPCFDKKVRPEQGTLTPGNSTPLTDGASAVLLASEEWAAAHNMPVQAYLTFSEVAAVDFFDKKEGC